MLKRTFRTVVFLLGIIFVVSLIGTNVVAEDSDSSNDNAFYAFCLIVILILALIALIMSIGKSTHNVNVPLLFKSVEHLYGLMPNEKIVYHAYNGRQFLLITTHRIIFLLVTKFFSTYTANKDVKTFIDLINVNDVTHKPGSGFLPSIIYFHLNTQQKQHEAEFSLQNVLNSNAEARKIRSAVLYNRDLRLKELNAKAPSYTVHGNLIEGDVISVKDSVVHKSAIGSEGSKKVVKKAVSKSPIMKNCPYCRQKFNLKKQPKFCPYCNEEL